MSKNFDGKCATISLQIVHVSCQNRKPCVVRVGLIKWSITIQFPVLGNIAAMFVLVSKT